MSLSRIVASLVLFGLCIGFAWGQEAGGGAAPPPLAVNDVKFDVPAAGKLNPDSPAEGAVTAKGTITTAAGWTCTKYEYSIKEGLVVERDSGSKVNPGGAWSFASTGKCTSGKTHSVSVTATFKDANGKTEEKSVTQTVSVK